MSESANPTTMAAALSNMVSLAKPFFTDDAQQLALSEAEAALTAATQTEPPAWPHTLVEFELSNGMKVTEETFTDRTEVTLWNEADQIIGETEVRPAMPARVAAAGATSPAAGKLVEAVRKLTALVPPDEPGMFDLIEALNDLDGITPGGDVAP